MERLIKKLEKVPPDQLQRLFSKKGNSIHRMVDDLLELSSYVFFFFSSSRRYFC